MLDTFRRIKWKNIVGLLVLILVVFALVYLVSIITVVLYGDCVEKGGIKVCFSASRTTVGRFDATTITTEVTNLRETISDAAVTMRLSPNLDNLSSTVQSIEAMAPGDTVKRDFKVSAQNERGRFKTEFDINADGKADKEIFITVE